MQEKVVFDTGIYIDLFNRGLHLDEFDGFQKIMYLVHPVLHELWIGAKGTAEVRHLSDFGNHFIRLRRLVQPQPATQLSIGRTCRKLRLAGTLDPTHPRTYNDITIDDPIAVGQETHFLPSFTALRYARKSRFSLASLGSLVATDNLALLDGDKPSSARSFW